MNPTRSLRRAVAVSLASVVTIGLAGCTTGGDDGESLEIDDGGEAAAKLAAAIQQTRATKGRFTTTLVETASDDEGSDFSLTIEGEFADGAVRSTTSMSEDDLFSGLGDGLRLSTGDREFSSVAELRTVLEDPAWSDTGFDEDEPLDLAALDGYEWIDITDLDGSFASVESEDTDDLGLDPSVAIALGTFTDFNDDPFRILSVVSDVDDVGTESVGGVDLRRYSATLPMDALYELLLADPAFDSEELMPSGRDGAIERYLESRTTVSADLFIDPDGHLARSVVTTSTDVEEQYADCEPLSYRAGNVAITTEFSDLGAEIAIPVPDPATTMSLEQLASAFPSTWPGDEGFEVFEELGELETVDGLRDRWDVIDDLSKFGYVIGLGVDEWSVPADEVDLGPVVVFQLSDEELVARYAELRAVLDAMPRTSTVLGELTRPELLWNVKWGLDTFGGDAAAADALSDAEMGALIDGYAASRGGPVGDGVFGPLPEGTELSEPLETTDEDLLDESDDEYYAGCPE